MQELLRHRVLSNREVSEYIYQMEKGDPHARYMLIIHHQRFVAHLVCKFLNTGVPFEDLFSIGTIGLIKGIDSFNAEKGQITTYVARCIKNEILSSLRNYKKRDEISLNQVLGVDFEGNEYTFLDMLSAKDDTLRDVEAKLDKESVRNLMDQVSDEDREAIEIYFGLNGKEGRRIIAKDRDLFQRVRKILRKMRKML